MSKAKAYVCIDASGAIAGGCIVIDPAHARHAIRTWLRSHPGCRVEQVTVQQAYRLLEPRRTRRRRLAAMERNAGVPLVAAHS